MSLRRAVLAGAIALVASCGIFEPDDHLVLYVAPQQVDCVGLFPTQCLQTRESPRDNWQLLYEGIIGFTYEAGFEYKLLVKRRHIDNPPADGSSIELRLIRVLEKKRVE